MKKIFFIILTIILLPITFIFSNEKVFALKNGGSSDIKAIYAGNYHSLTLKKDGTVWAWGSNEDGQLGTSNNVDKSTPVQVLGLKNIIAISGGEKHSLALTKDGTVWAWGGNDYGQLGDGTYINKSKPVKVKKLADVVSISANSYYSLALKKDGSVWAWGANLGGTIGDSSIEKSNVPIQIPELSNIKSISAGSFHSIALEKDSSIWVWGLRTYKPQKITGIENVKDVTAGNQSSLVLKNDGTVWEWKRDRNYYTSIADQFKNGLAQISGLSNIISVSVLDYHSMALKKDGTIWSWGYNTNGSLGDGTNKDSMKPVMAKGLKNISTISAGSGYSLAIYNGEVLGWGGNFKGIQSISSLPNYAIEPKYNDVQDFSEGLVWVKTGNLWGVIDKSGVTIVEPKYKNDDLYTFKFHEGLSRTKDDKWKYINTKGKVVISTNYTEVMSFWEGLAAVNKNGKWGFINKAGKEVIKPQYQDIGDIFDSGYKEKGFSQGLAAVEIKGKWGAINKSGKVVIKPIYENLTSFREGISVIRLKGKEGYINKSGKVISKMYSSAATFSDGLGCVWTSNGKIGFVNKSGKEVIKPQFDDIGASLGEGISDNLGFSDGVATVMKNYNWQVINKSGKTLFVNKSINDISDYRNGLAVYTIYKNGDISSRGYIDKKGKVIYKTSTVLPFNEGYGQVSTKKGQTFVNNKGKIVTPYYENTKYVFEGFAAVQDKNKKWGFISLPKH
ncbi:WG repeat-containing protein [Bacillus sp. FJAT-49736]|uniref:WG repeat-containing protein n=1 Tax=Bacillus sp. FJAT-49736 TaxID=2833582 RepID=UPI001BC9558B|nr:WG repeat-containing protein [Bacillus sp. FJAT-49736]MBS4174303.1 WG repeat-containing protein [Bacillus sp. FJAT-49736]